MKELKLYNWYGESFDSILPSSVNNLKAYKKQVRKMFMRANDKIKSQEKVDKDLYLRARTKLTDNLKRELSSHKVAYKNKVGVLRDSIKKLSHFDTMESLLKFEIKKLNKSKNEIQNYAQDFVYSLTKSADDADYKIQSINNLKSKVYQDETEIFKKYTIYNILLVYIQNQSDLDFDIAKIENLLLPIELNWVRKLQTNVSTFFKNIYFELEEQRRSLQAKKAELERQYNETYLLQKELFKREQSNIKLETNKKILEIEYEYNTNLANQRKLAKEQKEAALEKINSQKDKIRAAEAKNAEATEKVKQKSKDEILAIKVLYKKELEIQKHRSSIQLYKDLYSFLVKKHYKLEKIDFSYNKLNLKQLQEKHTALKTYFDNLKDEAYNKFIKKHFLSFINVQSNFKEGKLLVKSQYKHLLAESKKTYTYDGHYHEEESKALKELFINSRLTRLKFLHEKIEAKLQLNELEKSGVLNAEKLSFNKNKQRIQKEYFTELNATKQKLKTKAISKQAYKNKLIELKIHKKEAINEEKLKSKVQSNKDILKSLFWRQLAEKQINKKLYESKINEAQKSIPVETMKNLRWLSVFLNFIFPGLSELIFFKQYAKGIIMSIVSLISWTLIIPFAFGYYWTEMGGIPGFSDLGAHLYNFKLGIFPDARIYLFGGVISVILMVFVLIYHSVSSLGAYRIAKHLEYGSRPSKWTHTKRWMNTSGFPWMISLLGWVLMIFIVATPVITSILVSFTNYGFLHEAPAQPVDWVGLKQWGKWWIFREQNLFLSLRRVILWTVIWTIASTIIPISLGIIIAVLTNNQRIKFKKVFRLIYILPWAIPAFVTLTFIRSLFMGGDDGIINKIFLAMGIIEESKNWLNTIMTARILVIMVQTWIGYAWIFMLVTGNLQSIPKDIYEAGSVDGAKGRQLFWYLTLPSLLISIAPMLIGQFVGAFNNFTTISIFTGGGPAYAESTSFGEASTDIIISWVYKLTTSSGQFEGNQAFAAALTTLAASFSIAVSARGFIKSMSRRD
ncbi:carbohydrate ABC transporter permease [Mycoplasmopsis edwardii]|uniref:ABC transporter permease subunit n=1 Tax=Mycoplasmopsis edwardii TaxID=53558 RepID=A0ACD4PHD3_9BACT|nr:ABC transporter permease subunit [Mycoplasmopsis edwardii]WBP84077.1 ABC transporter permease subunit [Mycoplasmopsis edwardii]